MQVATVTDAILAYWHLRTTLGSVTSPTGRQLENMRDGLGHIAGASSTNGPPSRVVSYLEASRLMDGLSNVELAATAAKYWLRGEQRVLVKRSTAGVLTESRRRAFATDEQAAKWAGLTKSQLNEAIRRARRLIGSNLRAQAERSARAGE